MELIQKPKTKRNKIESAPIVERPKSAPVTQTTEAPDEPKAKRARKTTPPPVVESFIEPVIDTIKEKPTKATKATKAEKIIKPAKVAKEPTKKAPKKRQPTRPISELTPDEVLKRQSFRKRVLSGKELKHGKLSEKETAELNTLKKNKNI